MARVRITKLPKALSGLEMKMSTGLYGKGTNGNPQFRKSSYLEAGKISQQPTEVRDTLQPVAREGANLEAEKGETAMVNIDGIPAHFKIGGKRHSQGGTPLNLPDNSFIFSDTAKMKIKDPIMLAQFGMVPKKAGYTPAEIAKKYDINKFRQVLADPNTTDLERKTAELMISNYNMKLAKLALLQESSKGFPQGIPVVAMPYVMATGMNPEEFAQMDTQGEEEQPDADMGVSRYGGIPKAQKGLSHKDSVAHQAKKILKYEQLRGGPGGRPLPYYANPKYNTMLMDKIYPEVNKIMPNASAMEKGEAMDLIFNAGWDDKAGKIIKDPRAFALQEYYRKYDPSKLDAEGKWAGRKGAPYSFDQEYEETIGNLPENERRIMMNKGRDWYYQNINNPSPGVPNSNYKDTWYGRIWNTNDFNEFDPNNPNFTPKRYGGNIISQFDTKAYGGVKYTEDGLPMGQDGFWSNVGQGALAFLEAPQRAMMYGLTGTAGLLSGKGWTGEYEMPSETIRRNFPGHPGLEFAADLLADPFMISGIGRGIARAGLRKVIAKETADFAIKNQAKNLSKYEATMAILRNVAAKKAAKLKNVKNGTVDAAEAANKLFTELKTSTNVERVIKGLNTSEKVMKSKKFNNLDNIADQANLVQKRLIKSTGRVAQKQAAVTVAKAPIAGTKAIGKGIAYVAPPVARVAKKVATKTGELGEKAVEFTRNLNTPNVTPFIIPTIQTGEKVSAAIRYSNNEYGQPESQQLEQKVAQPKKPAYGKIISGSIGAMGPGSIARQNLATGDVEWFDQRTGKPWEQVVKQRVQPKPKDIQIKTKPKNVGTSKASSINLDEYQEVTE